MQNAYRTDYEGSSVDLCLASFTALSTLCENAGSSSNTFLYKMLVPILQSIEGTLDQSVYGEHKSKALQDYLSGLLQIILVRIGQKVDDDTASKIIHLIITIF